MYFNRAKERERKKNITHLSKYILYTFAYLRKNIQREKKTVELVTYSDVEMAAQCRDGGLGFFQQRKQIDNSKHEAS